MPKLTVTIITHDEAAHVGAAIESAAWADEVVVVDSQSTDDTAAIARRAGARVEVRDWPGFIDAEELRGLDRRQRLDPVDRRRRARVARAGRGDPGACSPPNRRRRATGWPARATTSDGGSARPTGTRIDQLRLYDRRAAAAGPAGTCTSRSAWTARWDDCTAQLRHYPYRDIAHHLRTIDRYTTLASRQLHEDRRTVSAPGVAARGLGAFVRNYVLRGGFRQGGVGLLVSALNSYYVFLKFAKLWELDHAGDRAAASDVQRPD